MSIDAVSLPPSPLTAPRAPRLRLRSRWRVGGGFFLLALLLFAAVAAYTGDAARRSAERSSGLLLQALAGRLALSLDQDHAERLREIETLAALDAAGDEAVAPSRWRTLLERMQRALPHHSWIGVTDADGRVIAATGGLLEGRSVAQRPWFANARQGPVMGDVHEALLLQSLLPPAAGGEPLRLLDFSAPRIREGRFQGVIGAHFSLRAAEERRLRVLHTQAAAAEIELLVLDERGRRLLGPDTPALPAALPAPGADPAVLAWGDGQTYLTARVAAPAPPERPNLGWSVVARQPTHVALADGRRQQAAIALAGGLAAVLFGLAGVWLAGRFTAPWQRLATEAAAAMPHDTAIPHGSAPAAGDELGQLAQSLSELLAMLRQREQALVRLNVSLESRVAERTRDLERANDDLRAFSRSVSHDLKGPLASVAMVLRQLQRGEGGQGGAGEGPAAGPAATLALLAAECERLAQLCEELLMLALVEQQPLQLQPLDQAAMVAEVVAELRRGPAGEAARRAEIVTDALAAVPPLPADPVLLRQVWHNLLANAVKFSGRRAAPRVAIEARRLGAGWQFTVADNGAGFDPAQAHRLFGVFQRLHRASDFAGTGVGLSIVRRVVHRHGGRVWAEGAPGRGARFHFTLGSGGEAAAPDR